MLVRGYTWIQMSEIWVVMTEKFNCWWPQKSLVPKKGWGCVLCSVYAHRHTHKHTHEHAHTNWSHSTVNKAFIAHPADLWLPTLPAAHPPPTWKSTALHSAASPDIFESQESRQIRQATPFQACCSALSHPGNISKVYNQVHIKREKWRRERYFGGRNRKGETDKSTQREIW